MKVAIIGLGRMGQRHAQVVDSLKPSQGLELVGLVDIKANEIDVISLPIEVSAEQLFSSAEDMLSATQPELLVIATTAPSHAELVSQAVKHGVKAILCEKPLAVSLHECDAMIAECDKHGVKLAVNHQMRFMEQYTIPKQACNSEKFGGLSSALVSAGNFGVSMNGTHYFEMFRFMTDEAPRFVSAWFNKESLPNPRGPQFSDVSGSIRIETDTGKRFYMDCSADQGHGMYVTYNCPFGRIDIDELAGSMTLTYREAEHRQQPTTRYGMPYRVETQSIAPADAVTPTKSVLEALIDGENYPTAKDALMTMEVLMAAHLSHEKGGALIDLQGSGLDRSKVLPIA